MAEQNQEQASVGPRWTEEYVARQMSSLAAVEPQAAPPVGGFHQAAAVLAYYDPGALRPSPRAARDEDSVRDVLANSTVVYDSESRPRSMLRIEIRREALRQLGSREEIRATLEANPRRPEVAAQRMFEAYVAATAPPLESQDLQQLEGTLQAATWLDGLVEVPGLTDIYRRIEWESLVKPFRDLVGDTFRGRASELDRLRGYVGFLDAQSLRDFAARGTRALFRWQRKPPLVVHGVGGVGKSTLLAKFILDHLEPDAREERLPFVFLDFDRPSLQAEEPRTLLAEAVRQLGIEFPDLVGPGEQLRNAWLGVAASEERSAPSLDVQKVLGELAAFLDFSDLRELTAALADPNGAPVWLLNGSQPGDVETANASLVGLADLLRGLGEHYGVAWVDLDDEVASTFGPADLVERIRSEAGWGGSPQLAQPPILADFLIGYAASDRRTLVVVLKNFGRADLPVETHDLIVSLVVQLSGLTGARMRLLLLDYPAARLPSPLPTGIARLTPLRGRAAESDFSGRPLLFVLDTFEEVQYRSQAFTAEVFRLLVDLADRLPRLRTVIVSRAPVAPPGQSVDSLPLGPLDDAAAVAFLIARGLDDPALAGTIARQVGGNPLGLRLALEVVRQEGVGRRGIEGLTTRQFLVFRAHDNQIVGQLYRRILGHIHDPDVRELVHLGLVLRALTPEVIQQVLAEPSGLGRPDSARSADLFETLAREVSLVTPAADGSLRFRPDVRRAMLPLLPRDEPARVRDVHERAAAFYRQQAGDPARAELIYHLLWLGRSRQELDAAWTPGVGSYLAEAVEELPPRARGYLAPRLGLTPDAEAMKSAELEDWERSAAQRGQELIRIGRADEVLSLLKERSDRTPGSPVGVLEAQALEVLGRWDEAREAVNRCLSELPDSPDSFASLKLALLEARIDVVDQQPGRVAGQERPTASEVLARFERVSERFIGEPLVLRLGLHRLELLRSPAYTAYALVERPVSFKPQDLAALRKPVDSWEANELSRRLADFLPTVPESRLRYYPTLCRELAGAIGARQPAAVLIALELAGLGDLEPLLYGPAASAARALLTELRAWDRAISGSAERDYLTRFLAPPTPELEAAALLGRWREITAEASPGWLERELLAQARTAPLPFPIVAALAATFASAAGPRTDAALCGEMETEQALRTTAL